MDRNLAEASTGIQIHGMGPQAKIPSPQFDIRCFHRNLYHTLCLLYALFLLPFFLFSVSSFDFFHHSYESDAWQKCESDLEHCLRGQQHEPAMDRVDWLCTSADEWVLSGRRAVVMVCWAAAGFGCSSLTFCFS